MREEKIHFRSAQWEIEGLYQESDSGMGAVITHPHPLYGGDMLNPVVEAIAAAYRRHRFATLRFNFRGTGRSGGAYDQGIGEQADVSGAIAFLKEKGIAKVHLSGYSFGCYVNALALQNGPTVAGMTMVAPPVAFVEFREGLRLPALTAVVTGSRDEFAPPERIRRSMSQWNPDSRLDIIDGADHFCFGYLDEITARLAGHIQPQGAGKK
jgi:uncharacterized protein